MTLEELIEKASKQAQVALDNPFVFKNSIKKVAIIGTGFAGLCSARSLIEAGFDVTVFELAKTLGGLWNYTEAASSKPPIQQQSVSSIQTEAVPEKGKLETYPQVKDIDQALIERQPPTACYTDLLTSFPTDCTCFPDYPMNENIDTYVGHEKVLNYLHEYTNHFNLRPHIQFNTRVESVCKKGDEWELVLCLYQVDSKGLKETRWREKFDAVVAASGLHQEPFIPDIPGLAEFDARWPEKISHSKQFRSPETFKDKNVLIVGSGISGVDIARSLDKIASSVIMTYRSSWTSPVDLINHMRECVPSSVAIKPEPISFSSSKADSDGIIRFKDGTSTSDIDYIIFCTGYKHSLGYLKQVSPADVDVPESHTVLGRSHPLNAYLDAFLISDPTLAFCGLCRFPSFAPYFYTQSVAIARVWKGQAKIPDRDQMTKFESEFDIGISYSICQHHRRMRQSYVTWLNYQTEHLHLDLPKVSNFKNDFEEYCAQCTSRWFRASEENIELTKKKREEKPRQDF
ncbi:hypothetical protein BY458DRAFT_445131 [Sporodiniella umbellata]|nr:hypothetical protein BY458DRAFT_445131 [Sporodiniella umbellata]